MRSFLRVVTFLASLGLAPNIARATEPASGQPASDEPREDAHQEALETKRPLPDYDGRGPRPTTAGDALLWAPRLAFAPAYLASEYLLRRPLGYVASNAERGHWPEKVLEIFTFDREHKVGVLPTAFYDFGFRPSVGLYFFADDAFAKGNAVRVHAATWGPHWLSVTVADRITIVPERSTFALRAAWTRRPDGLFAGLGPRTTQEDITRFGFTHTEVGAAFEVQLFRASTFRAGMGFHTTSFRGDETCCDEPAIDTRVAEGRIAYPPGFEGYSAIFQRVELALDSRTRKGDLTGVRFAADAEHAGDVRTGDRGSAEGGTRPGYRQWLNWGGSLGAFVDLDGKARVLGLIVSALFSDSLRGDSIPFTEQVVLGGYGPMRGFRPGRLTDRSALVATLQYEWPIWVWLDGTLHVAAGNVWGTHLDQLDPKLLRLSSGIGLRTVGSPDHQFEMLFGLGTETIEDGLRVTSVRVLIGGTRGF